MNKLLKIFTICTPVILILIGLMSFNLSMDGKMDQELSDDSKMLYAFIKREGTNIATKYGMRYSGVGLGGRNKVWLMCLSFDRHGELLTENDARKLIILCVNDFLKAVNHEEQLKPLLQDYPFTAKNLQLSIHNWNNGDYALDPYIVTVGNYEGEIGYFTFENPDSLQYKSEKYESFEEAIAIVNKS